MKKKCGFLLAIVFLFIVPTLIFAETIIFKSGRTIKENIIEKTDQDIKVDFGHSVVMTYPLNEIQSIESDDTEMAPSTDDQKATTEQEEPPVVSNGTYTNDNIGLSFNIPDGWFIVSGEKARQAQKERLDKEATYEKFVEKAKKNADGTPICPIVKDPKAIQKIIDPIKKMALDMYPIVTIYKYSPGSRPEHLVNPGIQLNVNDAEEDDTIENMKFDYGMIKRFEPDTKFIEEAHEITVGGVPAVRAIYEDPMQSGRVNLEVHFVKNNKKYEIYFVGETHSFKEYLPYFENVLSSFKIEEKQEVGKVN